MVFTSEKSGGGHERVEDCPALAGSARRLGVGARRGLVDLRSSLRTQALRGLREGAPELGQSAPDRRAREAGGMTPSRRKSVFRFTCWEHLHEHVYSLTTSRSSPGTAESPRTVIVYRLAMGGWKEKERCCQRRCPRDALYMIEQEGS